MSFKTKREAQDLAIQLYYALENGDIITDTALTSAIKRYYGMDIELSLKRFDPYTRTKVDNLKGVLIQDGWVLKTDRETEFLINSEKVKGWLNEKPI